MPQQQGQGGGSQDNSLDFLWMIVLIVMGLVILWYFGQDYITRFLLAVRLYEIYLIEYVLRGYGYLASFLHLPMPNTDGLVKALGVIHQKPNTLPLDQLVTISTDVGRFYAIPVAIVLIVLAVMTWFLNITERFKHIYSMETLRKSENRIWPQVRPVMKVNLVKKDLDEGPWAASMPPMIFAKKHHLLIEREIQGRVGVVLNEGAAHRVFALQVGQFYRDIETFPPHVQALFAIFIGRANQDRKAVDALLDQIAGSAATDKLDFKGMEAIIAKHKDSKPAKYVRKKHAYLLTAMATLLELARTDGVLATAEFIWLKPIDRPLWYMLNSVGRQTAFPEIAGVFAHWLAERKMNRPLRVPMVEEAVKALDAAINEVIYEPEGEA